MRQFANYNCRNIGSHWYESNKDSNPKDPHIYHFWMHQVRYPRLKAAYCCSSGKGHQSAGNMRQVNSFAHWLKSFKGSMSLLIFPAEEFNAFLAATGHVLLGNSQRWGDQRKIKCRGQRRLRLASRFSRFRSSGIGSAAPKGTASLKDLIQISTQVVEPCFSRRYRKSHKWIISFLLL